MMEKLVPTLNLRQSLAQKKVVSKGNSIQSPTGFTLIELLVVVVLMGVIAAIAAPSWLGFVSQRRVNAANDVVFRALQEAQSQAKHRKLSYSVAFYIPPNPKSGVPSVAVYPTMKADADPTKQTNVDPNQLDNNVRRSLGQDLELKAGQVFLQTNLNSENNTLDNNDGSPQLSTQKIITFDYMGTLPPGSSVKTNPLTITVGVPQGNTTTLIPSTKRCVKVTTLLGSLVIGKGQQDQTNNPTGCP